jgi:DNA-binding transcriptional regulator YdaS (Cro superfamily)
MTPGKLAALSQATRSAIASRDAAIVEAALEGMSREDIRDATGLSDTHLRRIERDGGVPPRPAGRPRTT